MSNHVYVNIINYIYDTLNGALSSSPLNTYTNLQIFLGEDHLKELFNTIPCMVIHLNSPPTTHETWGAIGKTRSLQINPTIDIAMRSTYPAAETVKIYGSATNNGILDLASDILNVIENAAGGLTLGGNTITFDPDIEHVAVAPGSEGLYTARIVCHCDTRALAGAR